MVVQIIQDLTLILEVAEQERLQILMLDPIRIIMVQDQLIQDHLHNTNHRLQRQDLLHQDRLHRVGAIITLQDRAVAVVVDSHAEVAEVLAEEAEVLAVVAEEEVFRPKLNHVKNCYEKNNDPHH